MKGSANQDDVDNHNANNFDNTIDNNGFKITIVAVKKIKTKTSISNHQRKVSKEEKWALYRKTQGVCIICGRSISRNVSRWTVEHYIPRAVYKWVPTYKALKTIENFDNLFIVHSWCNVKKNADLPTVQSIRDLEVNEAIKNRVLELYQQIDEEIAKYRQIKQKVLSDQDFHCLFCRRQIGLLDSTLRRKDNHKEREIGNAMCLCFRCSLRAGRKAYKVEMISKLEDPHFDWDQVSEDRQSFAKQVFDFVDQQISEAQRLKVQEQESEEQGSEVQDLEVQGFDVEAVENQGLDQGDLDRRSDLDS